MSKTFVGLVGVLVLVTLSGGYLDTRSLGWKDEWMAVAVNRTRFIDEWSDDDSVGDDDAPVSEESTPSQSETVEIPTADSESSMEASSEPQRGMKFYILDLPEATSQLVEKYESDMYSFYEDCLNEDSGEIWIHRGFEGLSDRTMNESEADVILIPAYLHYNARRRGIYDKSKPEGEVTSTSAPYSRQELIHMMHKRIKNPMKPHVLLTPTTNPGVSRSIGLAVLAKELSGVNLYSVGYERNDHWQHVNADRIIPVPYVVKPQLPREQLQQKLDGDRTHNFVFYAGDTRPHADKWAGCDRQMLSPLRNRTDMDVRIVNKGNRLNQNEYNQRMDSSEFCLIVCGDTPTSRSLASSMVAGCIPLRIGSRLRGQCEPPCHPGFGWEVTGLLHMPYEHIIDWNLFPEVDEQAFVNDPNAILDAALANISEAQRHQMRAAMKESQLAFTYGWGNPVTSTEFGDAVPWIWESIQQHLNTRKDADDQTRDSPR